MPAPGKFEVVDSSSTGSIISGGDKLLRAVPPGFASSSSGSTGPADHRHYHSNKMDNGSNNSSSNRRLHQHREDTGGSNHSSAPNSSQGVRTSSFVNLAAVVGTGLAESMDDFQPNQLVGGSHHAHLQHLAPTSLFRSSPPQPQQPQSTSSIGGGHHYHPANDDLNFARQSRHAAARMIGASPPRVDPLGLEAGSFNTGSSGHGGAPAPASLSLAGMASSSVTGGTTTKNNYNIISNQDQFLTGSFVSGSEGGGGGGPIIAKEGSSDRLSGMEQQRNAEAFLSGNNSNNRRSHLPASKDLGLTVMEPTEQWQQRQSQQDDSGGLWSMLRRKQQNDDCPHCYDPDGQRRQSQKDSSHCPQCTDEDAFQVEQGMRRLWVDDSFSTGRNSRHQQQQNYLDRSTGNSSTRSAGTEASRQAAEAELRAFCWDTRGSRGHAEPSRCLAILQAHRLQVPDVRSTCEAFGVLESFRADFSDRGIIFVGYYDIRSAQYAALELEGVLRRLGRGSDSSVTVQYCVPLNSSTQADESRIVLTDLPPYVDDHSLLPMLSSYGAIRTLKKEGGHYGGSSFEVEFHNLQDAKQALLELSSTQPWGPDVAVEVGARPAVDRKRGRELLAMIGRWRHGPVSRSAASSDASPGSITSGNPYMQPQVTRVQNVIDLRQGPDSPQAPWGQQDQEGGATQLVLGPDGRYSYMVVNNHSAGFPAPSNNYGNPPPPRNHSGTSMPPRHRHSVEPQRRQQQQIFHGPDGRVYIATVAGPQDAPAAPQHATSYQSGGGGQYWQHQNQPQQGSRPYQSGTAIVSGAPYRDRQDRGSAPYYTQVVPQVDAAQHHHSSRQNQYSGGGGAAASAGGEDKDNRHLVLDLQAVEAGRDSRTSLMVRNIPNKYTQQMLLSEFTDNGLGPGVIDFFYLPIDFKNRCNRGYAFINFVDPRDILPFHRRYYGQHWSTFNSDKICDITYARIQGKAAMLKRFENSALMEKDEEYKPLVFDRGVRVPFPVSGQR